MAEPARVRLPFAPTEAAAVPACPHAADGALPAPRPRVLSISKRTDIPAFYLGWLRERCARGWVDVPNPLYRHATDPRQRSTHVSLRPEHVQAIVWWSKNFGPYLRQRAAFATYRTQYFHITISPRRADLAWLEPDVPPLAELLRQVRELAALHGPDRLAWRFDPLVFWSRGGCPASSWDAEFFASTARALAALGVRAVYTSVADPYRKVTARLRRAFPDITLREPTAAELDEIAASMRAVAVAHGLQLASCCEPSLAARGLPTGACIDGRRLGALAGCRVSTAPASDRRLPGRAACACTRHTDIGDYETQPCHYGCVYCYANPRPREA